MGSNKEEALKAIENAERLFGVKDFAGAKSYALKARTLFPELEGIAQMIATFEVYTATLVKINGEIDFYKILGLDPSADKAKLKKQYRKMAVLLHPDKNKTVGADGAFKLVSEAWTLLSDSGRRSSYDAKRNKHLSAGTIQTNSSSSHNRLDTFWTVCTSCHIQYEYLRKYVNKRLSCKNCRGVFIAVETGTGPVNGSFPYSPWPCATDNGYASHGYNGVTYMPTSSVYFSGHVSSGFHSGHGTEYASNVSFQWSSYPGGSAGIMGSNGVVTSSSDGARHVDGKVSRSKANGNNLKYAAVDLGCNGSVKPNEPSAPKVGRPAKKRKIEMVGSCHNGNEEMDSKPAVEVRVMNGNENIKQNPKPFAPNETSSNRYTSAPAFDARKLLIEKARTVIRYKLEEMKLASVALAATATVADKNGKVHAEGGHSTVTPKQLAVSGVNVHQSELKKIGSTSIIVPDSDFHDFDKDRSEECFKPKQIWALYDEEDGMPRLYCLIRQVISVKPFKIHISYLNSKTDSEFGTVNWLDSGFTKSCGHFRAFNSDTVEQVNIFSHLLSREKAGRGGCVRIYPRRGDIWAVYRNWSPTWNRTTPLEVRHRYEMVEVLDNYSEELGVCVAPLVKLDGFKTVYQRNANKDAIRWIPRREMLRFSHQVPSWSLKGESMNLPDGCWDLDPAATPDELLQAVPEVQEEEKLSPAGNPPPRIPDESYCPEKEAQATISQPSREIHFQSGRDSAGCSRRASRSKT